MFRLFLCAFILFSNLLMAGGENSIWNSIDPMDLGVQFEGKKVKLKFLTDPSDLTNASWDALKTTYVATYLAAWRDKTPAELGIQGSKEDFLTKQFNDGLEALKESEEACFLSFEQEGEDGKPFLGIFAQRTGFEFDPDLEGGVEDIFFLRLMVFTKPAVLSNFAEIGVALVEKISPIISTQYCSDIVTISRASHVAQNKMLAEIGFGAIENTKITAEFDEDIELLNRYPQDVYTFFVMQVEVEDQG